MLRFLIGLLVVVVVVVVVAGLSMLWLMNAISVEKVTPVTALSPEGQAGAALVVYHPGLSDFPDRIVAAYADGLARSGWRVDITTTSKEAPAVFAAYDVVVLGGPVYGGLPKPLADYIARVDFGGKPAVILLMGAGDTQPTLLDAAQRVADSNGVAIQQLAYTTLRPNESDKDYPGSNTEKAVEMARDAGKALTLPPG